MKKHPIALQLYSLREQAKESYVGALELTAELGYEGVEFAGYGGLTSTEMRDHLQRLGLKAVSAHVSFARLKGGLDEEIAYHQELGNTTLVCPYIPEGFDGSVEAWQKFARDLTEIGKKAADQGFRVGYHNHSFEFKQYDGVYALDIFFEAADPRYVFAQLDLGWVLHGGENPSKYLQKFKGRCPLVHIKDFDTDKKQTDVGCGTLDLPEVLQSADEVGVEWLIIETEEYAVSAKESVKTGLANLKKAQNK